MLVTPFLSSLRAEWPQAHIALLAKPYACELLEGTRLVDEIITFDLPWTAQKNKYRFTWSVVRALRQLIVRLRQQKFDVTVDARMDIRSNLLAAATGARQRVGYDIGGGDWLLTDALPSDRDATHKIQDWLALVPLVQASRSPSVTDRTPPHLIVSENERSAASKALVSAAGDASPTVGYHPGGSHPGKRWPREQFATLAGELMQSLGGRHVAFLGPDDEDTGAWPDGVVVMRPSLRELMALLSCCDVFVCNDSGPMHIADALGVPVVAVFEVGNPKWFGPSGPRAIVVAGKFAGIGLSAAPLDDPPSDPVSVARVAEAVRRTLEKRR